MPKKKPIDKRINKLFDDIKQVEPGGETKSPPAKHRAEEQPKTPVQTAKPIASRGTRPTESRPVDLPQTDTALSLAVQLGQNNWATLRVSDETAERKWGEDEQLLVKQVTDQLSLALENAQLFQEAQRRAQEMTVLAEVGREISATLTLDAVLERITAYAFDLLSATSAAAYVPDEKSQVWTAIAAVGLDANEIKNDPVNTGEGILGKIVMQQNGTIMNNVDHMPGALTIAGTNRVDTHEHLLGVPVLSGETVTGLLAVWRNGEGNEFTKTELEFLTSLSRQTAIAIQNAKLFQNVTESQGQLSEALRIARIGYFEIDWPTQTISFTDELFSLLDTSVEREGGYQFPLDQIMLRFVVPEDLSIITKAINDAISATDGKSDVTSEVRYRTATGRTIWGSSIYKVERDAKGNPIKVVGSSQDITDRKTNELVQAAITLISDAALAASTTRELIKTVHEAVGTLLPAKNFYVAMYDADADWITFPYFVDEKTSSIPGQKLGRGLTSHVIRTGKPLRTTPEIYTELEESGEVAGDGIRSVDWLGIPLRSEGMVKGVVAVQSYDQTIRITESHKEILLVLAAQTSAALERLQAREALQRRNTYLAASTEIGRLVTSTLDLNTIFTRTVSLISERFGFYFSAIYIIDETGFHATLREAKGEAGEKMKSQKYTISVGSQNMIGQVTDTGESKISNNVLSEPLYQPNPLLLDTQSEAVISLRVGERKIGVIDIQSRDLNAFTKDDISVLQSLADQVAIAIDNASSYERSQNLIKELQELDQLKSQFLANMSHELRTPLNSIIGFSRVILKGIDGPVTDMQQQDLTAIYNSGQHLLGLINDVLDLARIEAGKMELNFEEVKLADMVNSVLSTAKGLVKEKPVQLIPKIPEDMPAVRGDTMRVRQVLINLLSNASKFTDEGSITVESRVQTGPNGKPEALINVIDTGPGISQEGQEKLFKAFSQVDGSATRKTGGSGLGLSICANLVQLHGGRIGVSSAEGHGSTFWFTLPLFHQPTEAIPEDRKVILAIDDDPQVISLYERYLNAQGYFVVPLTDASQAKERILELQPFAVTLDIMMPNIDGWAVLTTLKSDPATRQVPVIICSIIEQTDKGFSLGAADYLVKPILEDDLVDAVDKINKNGDIHEVLIIDDDPNDLRLIEKILNEHGQYKPILAEGGRKGWQAITANPPQAIILDIFMPEMDGFTILEKLHESPTLSQIPVLVVSGGGLTNEQQKQLDDYGKRLIAKGSLKEDELLASIETALKQIG